MASTSGGHKRAAAPAPLQNGNGSVAAHEGDDAMSERSDGQCEVEIVLPSGESRPQIVDGSTPMMDLMLQLCKQAKVSPSSYTLIAYNSESHRPLPFKSSQTVAVVGAQTIHLVSKKSEIKEIKKQHEKRKKQAQPFETTQRLIVHLPGSKRHLLRIPPTASGQEVVKKVCTEYMLNPDQCVLVDREGKPLDLQSTVASWDLGEVALQVITEGRRSRQNSVSSSCSSSATVSAAGMSASSSSSRRNSNSTAAKPEKKKRGFLGLFKRDSRSNSFSPAMTGRQQEWFI